MTIFEHRRNEAKEAEFFSSLNKKYLAALEHKVKIDEYLDDSLSVKNLKQVFFAIEHSETLPDTIN